MSILDPDLDFLPIPDPVVKKAPDLGSGSATLPLSQLCKAGVHCSVMFREIWSTKYKQIFLFQLGCLSFIKSHELGFKIRVREKKNTVCISCGHTKLFCNDFMI
jgi:hypothetical protein